MGYSRLPPPPFVSQYQYFPRLAQRPDFNGQWGGGGVRKNVHTMDKFTSFCRSAFPQPPLPPLFAIVSICLPSPPFCCVRFVIIFNTNLSLNDL